MKTKIAALSLFLLASAGTAALAQERDGVERDRSEGRAARERAVEARQQRQEQRTSPRQEAAEPARPATPPEARRPSEPRRPPEAGGERRRRPVESGIAGAGRGRWLDLDGDEINQGLSPEDLADREDRDEAREGRRWQGGGQGGGQGRRPDANGGGDRRGDGDRRWDGNGRDRRGDGDRNGHRGDGDRRGDNNHRWDGRGDGRGPPNNWPRWDGKRYPHSYNSRHRYRGHYWVAPVGFYVRSWAFGDYLPSGWFAPNYRILDWWLYDLPIPPPGFDWVRVGPDALLVDNYSGRVVQVVRFVFW